MGYKLVIAEGMWVRLQDHLLRDNDEHFAFLLVGCAGESLLARDLALIPDSSLENDPTQGIGLKIDSLLEVMNAANRQNMALVEAHSHPFSLGEVRFSAIDRSGQQEMAAYANDVLPGRPYGALVLGRNAVCGQVWSAVAPEPRQLERVVVLGDRLKTLRGDGQLPNVPLDVRFDKSHDRQVRAIGHQGQSRLWATTAAVVGAGGLGSIVIEQLAHLGIGHIVAVDDDSVEATNLHRLVGASNASVGMPKVEVARRHANRINQRVVVDALNANVRDAAALQMLAEADVVFGCVDTDSARLVLNELTLAHLIPYIDLGVGIVAEQGHITEAGGQIIMWVPGRPCLLCARQVNPRIAAEELESPEEREFRRRHGYVEGADEPEPAVISLNGTVASLAVTEFLAFVTGFRASNHYTYYDMLEQRVGPRIVKKDESCVACALEGVGHDANLSRYSHTGLPKDIPT